MSHQEFNNFSCEKQKEIDRLKEELHKKRNIEIFCFQIDEPEFFSTKVFGKVIFNYGTLLTTFPVEKGCN
jgi:hypothetical protein